MKRIHEGCGMKNPWPTWFIWTACFVAGFLSAAVVIMADSWWGELAWLSLPVLLAPVIWWEFVHAPSKMYRTWWP
jgi:hypothetical protein